MDTTRIELGLSSREAVILSLLSELGIATLTQDFKLGASVLETISKLDGAENVAGTVMKKLDEMMDVAALQITPADGMVS
jgi:hypothetical protein